MQIGIKLILIFISFIFSDYFMYQYFMQVVPTEVRTYTVNEDTFQFSVTERVMCWLYFLGYTNKCIIGF